MNDGRKEDWSAELKGTREPGYSFIDPADYQEYIGEKNESWTYLKSPYYMPKGYPDGIYRVGPLARMNVADRCGTPRADQELAEFHELQRTAVLSSFHYHHARLIEILY